MKIIKKLLITVILCFCFSLTKVYAASASIKTSKTTAYVGDSVTIYVSYTAAAWNLKVSGSLSDSIVGYDPDGNNTSLTKTYKLDTSKAGTYKVTLSGDVTDTNESNTTVGTSVTVTINNKPSNSNSNKPSNSNSNSNKPSNSNSQSNSNKPSNSNSNKPSNSNSQSNSNKPSNSNSNVPSNSNSQSNTNVNTQVIKNITIVGYDIDFNPNVYEYQLDVPKNIDAFYYEVEGVTSEFTSSGKIMVKDKDQFELTINNKGKSIKYTFKLNRKEFEGKIKGKSNNTLTYVFLGTTILFGILTFVFGAGVKDGNNNNSNGFNNNMYN